MIDNLSFWMSYWHDEGLSAAQRLVSNLTSLLTHPGITAIQFHGMVPGILLGTLWLLSAWVRLKELQKLRTKMHISMDGRRIRGPGIISRYDRKVTVVMPTRGYRPQSVANWQAILAQEYAGDIEYIFVLENAGDVAYATVQSLVLKAQSHQDVRIVFSGFATKCSQKIHNLIAGIRAADSAARYILCLDDDVHLHPKALESLVRDMEASPELRVATGYPFDVPPPNAGVLAYAVLSYHLPLVIGLSLSTRTHFVWGGCMMFHAEDLRDDRFGFLAAWADGGYSDDLTLAARCTQLGLLVMCPPHAIYPQWLEGSYSLRRYWNYLRRQLFVLDTYTSPHNRRTNHALAALHCYGSWGFVLPVVTVFARVLLLIVSAMLGMLARLLYGSTSVSAEEAWHRPSFNNTHSRINNVSLVLFTLSTAYMAGALHWMMAVVMELLLVLNPQLSEVSDGHLRARFKLVRLWLGFVLGNALLPLCMVYTFATRHIEWAGVQYTRRNGKVVRVEHVPTSFVRSD